MKFIIRRASSYYDTEPCEEAIQEELKFTDTRNIDDPMKNKYIGESWYTDEGYFNHRVENGKIKRDYMEKVWTIEINSLEELTNFYNKYGNIIIYKKNDDNECYDTIKIYDSWVE